MKKKLEEELMSLAHSILQLRGRDNHKELKERARELYEKLAVLSFVESHFSTSQPSIGQAEAMRALMEDSTTFQEVEKKTEVPKNSPVQPSETTPFIQPEKPATQKKNAPVGPSQTPVEDDLEAFSYPADEFPDFEPYSKEQQKQKELTKPQSSRDLFSGAEKSRTRNDFNEHKKSLNEKLQFGLKFGLNDRLAYTKHLFNGNPTDFDRIISQLNTFENFHEAKIFIEEHIKPDYDWSDQEEYEKRFLVALEHKMN